ncbi:MAG: undecaprenyl-diphosphate phosphatase [Chloroflexaceae bacterium]|nr:undecaprenyl-diphosphate phosphatase [Chloroflexaceae bacterium]
MSNHSSTPTVSTSALSTRHTALIFAGGGLLFVAGLVLAALTGNVWLQVIMLAVVQGISEFLPISSTAHLLITSDLIGFEHSIGGTFEIFIQLGSILAVIGFYINTLIDHARQLTTSAAIRHFWIGVFLAFLPAAIIGLALHDWIKAVLFETPTVIATSLIIGGILFIVVEQLPPRQQTINDITQVSWRQAIGIGLAQVLALIPGTSRSGASIFGGLAAGLDRPTATAFSFYLSMPTLGAATIYDLLSNLDQVTPDDLGRLLLGTVVTAVVSWFCIAWLLRYVARNSFVPFGIYRIGIGLVILVLVAFNWL